MQQQYKYQEKKIKLKNMLFGITLGKSQFINQMVCTVGHKYFWITPSVKLSMNTTLILSLSL